MTQQARPSFELLLGEVSLKAPETPLYLKLATQVLEARRLELENGHSPDPDAGPGAGPQPPAPPDPSPAAATLDLPSATKVTETVEALAPDIGDTPEAAPDEDALAGAVESPRDDVEPVVDSAVEEAPTAVEAVADETVVDGEHVVLPLPLPDPAPAPAAPEAQPARRARWFRGQLPVVHFEDGSSRVMESLDALKDLLRSRGLTPHPRGDASMLLWQVRNRLNLSVGQVDA